MKRVFAIALVLIGTPLEGYFYWFRFTKEGMASYIAWAAGAGLILLLSVLIYLAREDKRLYIPALALACFSVISTSAGQSFATLGDNARNAGSEAKLILAQDVIESAKGEMLRLDTAYDALVAQESASVTSLQDRYEWTKTLATVEAQKKTNRAQREKELARYDGAVADLNTASVMVSTNIYTYYSSLFGLSSTWLQFILHSILSLFLTAMTPTGVALWPRKEIAIPIVEVEKPKIESHRAKGKVAKTEEQVAQEISAVEQVIDNLSKLPESLTPRQAAVALGSSHTPLYYAVKKGQLEALSMNPVILSRDKIVEWFVRRHHA
jgi:hypothetical protein